MNPNNLNFDALESAPVMMPNKKQTIIKHLRSGEPFASAPAPSMFQPNGTIVHDSFEQYLGSVQHYSSSALAKLANGTPLDFQYETTEGAKQELERFKNRSAFDLGTFVHQAILEPEMWDKVVVEPAASRASHDGCDTLIRFWEGVCDERGVKCGGISPDKIDAKKIYIDEMKAASGLTCIDMKSAIIVQQLHNRWMNYENGLWARLINAGLREHSMYTDDFLGLPQRVRPDAMLFEDQIGVNAIVSVKTTSANNMHQYAYQSRSYGYDVKEAMYQAVAGFITGKTFDTTINVVLQTVEPFNTCVMIYNDNTIRTAMDKYFDAVSRAKDCLATGKYPGWEMFAGEGEFGMIDLEIQ